MHGSGIFHVEDTDPFQFATEWNESAKRTQSLLRRMQLAWDELSALIPELRMLQEVCRDRRLAEHPDAGTALDHIESLNLDIPIPKVVDAATLTALTNEFQTGLIVRYEDLPPVSAASNPVAERLEEWNPLLDYIHTQQQNIDGAQNDKHEQRDIIKAAQIVVTNCNTIIADSRFEIAQSLISLRALQRIAVALDTAGARPGIHNAATANLRVSVYDDRTLGAFCDRIPSLRIGTARPVEVGGDWYGPAP